MDFPAFKGRSVIDPGMEIFIAFELGKYSINGFDCLVEPYNNNID